MDGMMEGLKYVYLNPEDSVKTHLAMVKEFKGAITNQKVIEFGMHIGTALGMVPAFKNHVIGYMDPELVKISATSVQTYMGVKTLPPVEKLYTNKFVGSIKLTDAEWATVEARSQKYLPKKPS